MERCIIGVGNELRGDDGIGLAVVEQFINSFAWPDYGLFAVGNRLFEIPEIMRSYAKVAIIDALPPGNRPGRIKIFQFEGKDWPWPNAYSLHDLDLIWQLQFAYRNGYQGKSVLIGIEAESITYRKGLSPELSRLLPEIISEIKPIIRDLG